MKKIKISVLLITAFIMSVFPVNAEVTTNITETCVEVELSGNISSGACDEPVLLHIKDASDKTVHIDEKYTGDNGNYRFELQVNPQLGGGIFSYIVSTVDAKVDEGKIRVQDVLGMKKLCEGLGNATTADDIKNDFNNFSYITENSLYSELDKTNMYKAFYNEAQAYTSIGVSEIDEIMEKIIVLESANQDKLEMLLGEDNRFANADKIGLSQNDIKYYKEISEKGLANINANLEKKGFVKSEDFLKALKALIYINNITNNTSMGTVNTEEIITTYYDTLEIDISRYNGLVNKETALQQIVNSGAYDITTFKTAYNTATNQLPVTILPSAPGGSSSSSGGGGGGGGSYSPTVSGVTESVANEVKYDSGFSDMAEYDWAQEAVSILRENRIINGKTDNSFAPSDNVTREEFVTMLLRAVPVKIQGGSSEGAYEFIKSDSFDRKTINSWNTTGNGVSYENGMMEITSNGGTNVQIKRYDSSNVLSTLTGDSMEAANEYGKHKVAIRTKMTVLNGKDGYTELALLDGTNGTKVHLVRLVNDGENTFKILINQTSAGINSGITNEMMSKVPYGTMVDVYVVINGNVTDFYLNGEKVGSTKYTTGIPTWSSGVKIYSAEGTAENPFTGAFDDLAMYFYKGDENPLFEVSKAYIANGKVNLEFTTEPSEFAKFEITVDGEQKEYSINGSTKTISVDYPYDKAADVKIISGGKDIFGTYFGGNTEFTATKITDEDKKEFLDVSESDWYYDSVMKAAELEIVNGISENVFGTGSFITRQDMAVMAFRALRYIDTVIDTDISDVVFADGGSISGYASDYVKILKKLQIINGYSDGSFKPFGTAVRAEAAQIIYKLFGLVNK